jgi:cell division protein FtsN
VAMQMPPTAPAAPAQSGERYAIQLGSFTIESSAHRIADRFNGIGIAVTVLHSVDHDGREWFAVRTNEVASSDAASAMLKTIQSVGGVEPIMVHRHVRAA